MLSLSLLQAGGSEQFFAIVIGEFDGVEASGLTTEQADYPPFTKALMLDQIADREFWFNDFGFRVARGIVVTSSQTGRVREVAFGEARAEVASQMLPRDLRQEAARLSEFAGAPEAAAAGVDGLIPVCAGAGGHAGSLSPFALVGEIRQFFDKTVVLSGAMSRGDDIAAAQMLGADLAYMGTRFINTTESQAQAEYKQMITETTANDVVYTPKISGINANFLLPSILQNGLDPETMAPKTEVNMGEELDEAKAWSTIWSAGQGVGNIDDVPTTAALVDRLEREYRSAFQRAEASGFAPKMAAAPGLL